MNKLLAAIVASTFAFSSLPGFAADAAKKIDLTSEQRAEMRERAAQMKTRQNHGPVHDTIDTKIKVEKKGHKAKESAVRHGSKAKKTA